MNLSKAQPIQKGVLKHNSSNQNSTDDMTPTNRSAVVMGGEKGQNRQGTLVTKGSLA